MSRSRLMARVRDRLLLIHVDQVVLVLLLSHYSVRDICTILIQLTCLLLNRRKGKVDRTLISIFPPTRSQLISRK